MNKLALKNNYFDTYSIRAYYSETCVKMWARWGGWWIGSNWTCNLWSFGKRWSLCNYENLGLQWNTDETVKHWFFSHRSLRVIFWFIVGVNFRKFISLNDCQCNRQKFVCGMITPTQIRSSILGIIDND